VAVLILLRRRHRHSSKDRESALFSAFKRAAKANDAQGAVAALYRWLDITGLCGHPASLSVFARAMNDPELSEQLDRPEHRLYGYREAEWSGQALYRAVARVRRKHRHFRPAHGQDGFLLAPLNPR